MKVEINNIELAPWAPLRGEYKTFPWFTNRTAQDILSRWIPIFKDCEQLTISPVADNSLFVCQFRSPYWPVINPNQTSFDILTPLGHSRWLG